MRAAAAVAPPRGALFQEGLAREPFWMLVACQLVNKTTWEQAEPAFLELRRRWPKPLRLARAPVGWLETVLKPLGLWRLRAERLKLFALHYDLFEPKTAADVSALPGCGRYAADSWAIFVERNLDVEPGDGKLNWYLAQNKTLRGRTAMTTAAKKEPSTQNFVGPATTKSLLAEYNARAEAPLKSWKGSKEALAAKIAALPRGAKPADDNVVRLAEEAGRPAKEIRMVVETLRDAQEEVDDMPIFTDAKSVKDAACRLLVAKHFEKDPKDGWSVGFSFNAILLRLCQLFPGCKTSEKCLRWYLMRVRQADRGFAGYQLSTRFKRPISRKG